jgi:hypothetical protein
MRKIIFTSFCCLLLILSSQAQEHSIAREWNEMLLESIRNDFARPTVHARNLFHSSAMMYDIWATYTGKGDTYFLGKEVGGYNFELKEFTSNHDLEASIHEAISYAMYRLLRQRFQNSPNSFQLLVAHNQMMASLGYSIGLLSTDYEGGWPYAFGNYVAEQVINYGLMDNANEMNDYVNTVYTPINPPLVIREEGNPDILDKNRWQPLAFDLFIDQSGNPIGGATPEFLSPEWGKVVPFALKEEDLRIEQTDSFDYYIYHDPGEPALLTSTPEKGLEDEYIWGHTLVALWSAHLDSSDDTMIDISPGNIGNVTAYPTTLHGLREFYDLINGGDLSVGYELNPVTNQPYPPQMVKRGDYGRVLAEFWADGPDSETPPGHWFTILNYVNDRPELIKKFNGKGSILSDLEWDVKSYLLLGGAMHDVAVCVWGLKGYYDYVRPVSAIRAMAEAGQSTNEDLPNYHPHGLPLIEGYIELIKEGDALAGSNNQYVDEIKIKAWRGPEFIEDPLTDEAGVGWILAKNWWPYQRPTFVTPPFAGYVSGHSTFSRAGAEILTALTGDPYFPGGVGEFLADKDTFLVFEEGPSEDIILQWAKYYDASDQCSLSRIWGGIHPPCDDVPGRLIGIDIGHDVFELGKSIFYKDEDNDGYYTFEDCNDNDPMINPGASEICNGQDTDCNGLTDDGLTIYTYYRDLDGDGFGGNSISLDTCMDSPPPGFVDNNMDCNDSDTMINPNQSEICNDIDNNCNGIVNDGLEIYRYYADEDGDGYGNNVIYMDTCISFAPSGFVTNDLDCNDWNGQINPDKIEICDGIDNDCNSIIDDGLTTNRYFLDSDNDGFGTVTDFIDTCVTTPPKGYVQDDLDCNDNVSSINPNGLEIPDNGIDEDCNGIDLFIQHKIFPTIFTEQITIHFKPDHQSTKLMLFNNLGQLVFQENYSFENNYEIADLSQLAKGIYFISLVDLDSNTVLINNTIIKI